MRSFYSKIKRISDGCQVFTGHITPKGYGQIKYRGRVWQAHRLMYTLYRGAIPADMTIDHLCENKRCVNPDHLEVVTRAENTRRYYNKRRCSGGGVNK